MRECQEGELIQLVSLKLNCCKHKWNIDNKTKQSKPKMKATFSFTSIQ